MEDDYDLPISAADYLDRPMPPEPQLPNDVLGRAIKEQWRGQHPGYWSEIYWRYRRMPIDDAIECVSAGYSSPAHAMNEGVVADYRRKKS